MTEAVLMRTFIMLYASDFESVDNDDGRPHESGKSSSSERRAFTLLSSVCCDWHQALTGWPQSPTPHWVRHQLKKPIERQYISPIAYVFAIIGADFHRAMAASAPGE